MFQHVRAGDPPPSAADWNGAMDAAKAHRQARDAPLKPPLPPKDRAIYIRNETAGALPSGSILGISAPIILPSSNLSFFREKHYYKGSAPTSADAGQFAVTLVPLGEEMIGECVVSGLAKVLVDDGDGDFAAVVDSDPTHLARSEDDGAPIVWVDSEEYSAGLYWAVVLLGGGAGGGECPACPNIFEIATSGPVTGGSATLTFTIQGTTGAAATINWNDTAATAETAIITANSSKLNTTNFGVMDGPWPFGAMYLVFKDNLAETMIPLPAVGNSLTGTNTSVRVRRFSAPFGSEGWIS